MWEFLPIDGEGEDEEEIAVDRVELPWSGNGPRISVGWSSPEFSTLTHNRSRNFHREFSSDGRTPFPRPLTLRVEGTIPPDSETARALLLKYAEPVLFQVDVNLHCVYERSGQPFALKRYPRTGIVLNRPVDSEDDQFLSRELLIFRDDEKIEKRIPQTLQYLDPLIMDLYWRARTLSDSPTFQYVAFYQVLEFCSSFFPYDKDDKDGKRLQIAINASVNPANLRSWLKDNEVYSDWSDVLPVSFASPPKPSISQDQQDEDLLSGVSKRISDMRNKLLHTKYTRTTEGAIFPFSRLEWQLGYDLCLIEFVVQEMIIHLGKSQHSLPS